MSLRPVNALMNDDFPEPVMPINAMITSSDGWDGRLDRVGRALFWDLSRDLEDEHLMEVLEALRLTEV